MLQNGLSVRLHAYCGPDVFTVEREKLPKDAQTENSMETCNARAQTNNEKSLPLMCSFRTQTINSVQKEMTECREQEVGFGCV